MTSIQLKARRAFTIAEGVIVLLLAVSLIAMAAYLLSYGSRSMQRTSEALSGQQAGRMAISRLIREIQQSIEVVTPLPGSTMPYALVRDQVSCARWYYQVPQKDAPGSYELWRYVDDKDLLEAQRKDCMIRNVKRLTFTTESEGALQINILFRDGDTDTPLLTTVRLRNIAAADEAW